jgi:hypothetical protein
MLRNTSWSLGRVILKPFQMSCRKLSMRGQNIRKKASKKKTPVASHCEIVEMNMPSDSMPLFSAKVEGASKSSDYNLPTRQYLIFECKATMFNKGTTGG